MPDKDVHSKFVIYKPFPKEVMDLMAKAPFSASTFHPVIRYENHGWPGF
jgi:hypothetical protein